MQEKYKLKLLKISNCKKKISLLLMVLFSSILPTYSFAISNTSKLNSIYLAGLNIVQGLSSGIIKIISIITLIRLFNEFTKGVNENKLFDILREFIAVVLVMMILPKIPALIAFIIRN